MSQTLSAPDSAPDSATASSRLPDEAAATTAAPRDVPQPPEHRPPPALKKGVRQVFFDFNHAPRDIIRLMDEVKQREQAFQSQRKWRQLVAWLCFPAGLVFLILDIVLGYNVCTFTLVTVALWIAGIVALIWLRRQRAAQFDSRYDLTREMFDVLKDDVAGERTLVGWLDLTGAQQESKLIRHATSTSGQPILHYQDEWLRMKAHLYDGNVLRASLFERVKARQGYYRIGSISGKRKWRAGSVQDVHQLRIAVSANPDQYTVQPVTHQGAIPNSRFLLEEAEVAGGQLRLGAATLDQFDAWDVLNAMRFAYDHLQTRQAA
jgi:hypothetical protein